MVKCSICGAKFAGSMQLESHWAEHAVRPVKEDPLSYLLCLPDGITAGRYEAVEAFVEAYGELKQKHPDVQFSFFPFAYKTDSEVNESALTTILAIAK